MKHGGAPPLTDADDLSDWLDLSTGINPHSYPVPQLDTCLWEDLPKQTHLDALLSIAREYYCVPDEMGIIAVPGTESAIAQLPAILPGSIGIVEPTYSSHRMAWNRHGHAVQSIDKISPRTTDQHLLVVNPNNPTGQLESSENLLLTAQMLANNRTMIVDEAFMDCTPGMSLVPHLRPDLPIVVLKSFGKFFGLAGLRLGFVVGDSAVLAKLTNQLGEWCISGPALEIGCRALKDRIWQSSMRSTLRGDLQRLKRLFSDQYQLVGATQLFLTYRYDDAMRLHQFLADRKIWTRCFNDQPTWLRFGFPGTDTNFERLAKGLTDFSNTFAYRD